MAWARSTSDVAPFDTSTAKALMSVRASAYKCSSCADMSFSCAVAADTDMATTSNSDRRFIRRPLYPARSNAQLCHFRHRYSHAYTWGWSVYRNALWGGDALLRKASTLITMRIMRVSVFVGVTIDGFLARVDGSFDFLAPFEEDHGFTEFWKS